MGNARMVEILRQYGAKQIIVDSACDWGISEPLGVAKTAKLALQQGVAEEQVRLACYQNPLQAYGQSGQMKEEDWLNPVAIDQRAVFEGNSILRGAQEPAHDGRSDYRVAPVVRAPVAHLRSAAKSFHCRQLLRNSLT
jgi:hypothetical protein